LRSKLAGVRDKTVKQLERVGLALDNSPAAGMFLWADTGCDSNVLTEKGLEHGYLFAPGSLFSPNQLPSTRMRFNVANMADPGLLRFLEREIGGT
jgi:DNA-binding transcriptional MocR family regulator